jgi:hypothetical protein
MKWWIRSLTISFLLVVFSACGLDRMDEEYHEDALLEFAVTLEQEYSHQKKKEKPKELIDNKPIEVVE